MGPCWLALLSTYCASALIIVKGGARVDGGWIRSSVEGNTINGCTKVASFVTLDVVVFVGDSAVDGVANTGGIMRVNGGRAFALLFSPTGSNIPATTVLLAPASTSSRFNF